VYVEKGNILRKFREVISKPIHSEVLSCRWDSPSPFDKRLTDSELRFIQSEASLLKNVALIFWNLRSQHFTNRHLISLKTRTHRGASPNTRSIFSPARCSF